MTVALIDNGSLEPAAHQNLRAVAAALSLRTNVAVHAVSWKHSDRIDVADLGGIPAWTLASWMETQLARGERQFVFVPFFISAQGAIGSALRSDLERLQRPGVNFEITVTDSLAARGEIAGIVAARIRETMAARALQAPPVIVVDHGGPSPVSARLRDELAAKIRAELGSAVGRLAPASMEGGDHAQNRPLLADQLATPGFDHGDVVIAPLFLSAGRHAGPQGDLVQIARAAERRAPNPLRCHFTQLVGTHPRAIDALATALRETLAHLPDHAAV